MWRALAVGVLASTVLAGTVRADDSISGILSNPSAYDGKTVNVTGTVSKLAEKTSAKGNAYDTFSMCSSNCIHVFVWGHPAVIVEGKPATVVGTFTATKSVGGYTFTNEIEADTVK